MNRDFYAGLFFGGNIGMMMMAFLYQFGFMELTPLLFIILLDIVMAFNLLLDNMKGGEKNGRRIHKRGSVYTRRSRRRRI